MPATVSSPAFTDEPARGAQTPVSVVQLAVDLVLTGGVSLHGVPRVLELLANWIPTLSEAPDWTSARLWLLRLGCYALLRPKEPADDWAYLIDHTIQIGSMKCFVILGIRLSELPAPERCLAHHDLQLIALVPMVHSTGEVVAAELEKAARQTTSADRLRSWWRRQKGGGTVLRTSPRNGGDLAHEIN